MFWSVKKIIELDDFRKSMYEVLSKYDNWLLTIPSINEGRNYLFTNSDNVREQLISAVGSKFVGLSGTTDKLYLRKELMHFVRF